jgi:hypothetical protein
MLGILKISVGKIYFNWENLEHFYFKILSDLGKNFVGKIGNGVWNYQLEKS